MTSPASYVHNSLSVAGGVLAETPVSRGVTAELAPLVRRRGYRSLARQRAGLQ